MSVNWLGFQAGPDRNTVTCRLVFLRGIQSEPQDRDGWDRSQHVRIQNSEHGVGQLRKTVIEFTARACVQVRKCLNQPFNVRIPDVTSAQAQAVSNLRKSFRKIAGAVPEVVEFRLIPCFE